MWTIDDFDGKILVQYVRKKDKIVSVIRQKLDGPVAEVSIQKGKKVGVVVAIGRGIIGWSLCDAADEFSKEIGLSIAIGRAVHASNMADWQLPDFYAGIPDSLVEVVDEMVIRSMQYFK